MCCVLALALLGLQCTPGDSPSISVIEDELSVSVVELEDGVIVTNVSEVACIVFVRSPEGEQRFELDVGESVTVTSITKPIEMKVVSR